MSKSAWFAALLLLIALPAHAEVKRTHGTKNGKPYLEMTNHRVMTGTVIAVNKKTREVKLVNEAGDTLTTVAASQVKNFSKVEVNDVVKIEIMERATIEVSSEPAEEDTHDVKVASGEPGGEAKGTTTERKRATATIVEIDKAKGIVTLKGQDGNTFTAKPKRKETLDQVKVGDLVVFTAVRTTATSLVKAEAKKE